MNHDTTYTKYQPKVHRERMPIFWWARRWSSIRFITRELTSVFVALFAVELLFFVRAIYSGPESYTAFMEWLKTPGSLVLHIVGFSFATFHSITWFNLAPKALVLKLGSFRIPDAAIIAGNFLGWIAISAALVWIVLK